MHTIENWVLGRREEGVGGAECPMQKFGVGGEDAVRREEGMRMGSGWRVWVWWGGSGEEAEERIGAWDKNGDESGSGEEGVERLSAVRQTARLGWEFKGAELDHENREATINE